MEPAVYTMIGIVVGAILSGTVQLVVARRMHINEGRAAARIVFADLVRAQSMLEFALSDQGGDWWPLALDFEGWAAHRETLAQALNHRDFHRVSEAFFEAERIEELRREKATYDEGVASLVSSTLESVLAAQTVVIYIGMTWTDRLKERVDLARGRERYGDPAARSET